jgi:hypothetical protein
VPFPMPSVCCSPPATGNWNLPTAVSNPPHPVAPRPESAAHPAHRANACQHAWKNRVWNWQRKP